MEQKYYCPKCSGELEKIASCGTVGYFCNNCRNLVSKSKILTHEEIVRATAEMPEEKNKKGRLVRMNKILIPVDSSEFSERAVEEGKKMAKAFGSQVVLMYVVAIRAANPRFGIELSHISIEDPKGLDEEKGAKEMIDKYKESFGEMKDNVETFIVHGLVADEIIKAIKNKNIDFVIMGSHGIGSALYRTLLGSVTNKVVHHSTKPVLVIK